MKHLTAAFLALMIATGTIAAKQPGFSRTPELVPETPRSAAIPLVGRNSGSVEYYIDVPDDAFALTIAITDSPADLDLFVTDASGELAAYSERSSFNEQVVLSRISDPALTTGRYTIEVAYQYQRPPIVGRKQLSQVPFSISASLARVSVSRTVEPGESVRDVLHPSTGMIRAYAISVPTDASALRIDISDADGDLDLFLSRDELRADPFAADYWAQSVRASETLIVDSESVPPLRPGHYYALVIDQIAAEQDVPFTLTVSDSRNSPVRLRSLPSIPLPQDPFEKSLIATVEVLTENAGGSGVVVSPDGYILTNYHVIEDDSGEPASDITIGFSLDHHRPPVEVFNASVVEVAEDRDLALLKISEGRYGQPLPRDYVFPFVELAKDSEPPIGTPLHFIGYPWIGGTGSRASITYTQGVVSGYQTTPFGSFLKTDAEINEGNSGGAALNGATELVGLPTQIVGADGGQLAFVTLVTAIPDAWMRRIEER